MADADNTQAATASEASKPKRRRTRVGSPRFSINIDRERIMNSVRRDSAHCMIAEAISEAHPEYKNVSVALDSIRFTDPQKNVRYTYLTPREAQIALIYFDRGVMPEPFGFRLRQAARITRSQISSKPNRPLSRAENREHLKRIRTAEQRAAETAIERGEIYEPPAERVDQVLRALDDPDANLGPAIAITPVGGNNHTSHPVIVGGNPPAKLPGNLARTRKFGIRQYLE